MEPQDLVPGLDPESVLTAWYFSKHSENMAEHEIKRFGGRRLVKTNRLASDSPLASPWISIEFIESQCTHPSSGNNFCPAA